MTIQTIETEGGETLVVMSRREYDSLLARAGDEDAEDRMSRLLLDEARKDARPEDRLPAEVSKLIMSGDGLVTALRRWRGLTEAELASAVGITEGELRELERNSKAAPEMMLGRIADSLKVPMHWII